MERLQRAKAAIAGFITRLRLRLKIEKEIVIHVEVGGGDFNTPGLTGNMNPLKRDVNVRLHEHSIRLEGDGAMSWLTEENLTVVLSHHPDLTKVEHLCVSHQPLFTCVPVSIGQLCNLTMLDLSSNKLHDLPWSIVYLRRLKILDLSRNQFRSLPPVLGQLSTVEQLFLDHNLLETLPTCLLFLDNLKLLQVTDNPYLHAPPHHVCDQGIQAIFTHLRKRRNRSNCWHNHTMFYRDKASTSTNTNTSTNGGGGRGAKSLVELCVATVLQFHTNFYTLPYVPPALKRHLHESSLNQSAQVSVAKCSKCRGYFSTTAHFDDHDCRSRDTLRVV